MSSARSRCARRKDDAISIRQAWPCRCSFLPPYGATSHRQATSTSSATLRSPACCTQTACGRRRRGISVWISTSFSASLPSPSMMTRCSGSSGVSSRRCRHGSTRPSSSTISSSPRASVTPLPRGCGARPQRSSACIFEVALLISRLFLHRESAQMSSRLTGKKILITGGAGFIGHNLALKLKQMGATVNVADSLQVNNLNAFASNANNVPNQNLYLHLLHERLALLNEAEAPLHVIDLRDYHVMGALIHDLQPD